MHLLTEVFLESLVYYKTYNMITDPTIGVDHDVDVFVCTHEMQLHNLVFSGPECEYRETCLEQIPTFSSLSS